MDDFRPRALQLLDDVHACDELLLLRFEAVDLLDLLVQLLDLLAQLCIARLLRLDQLAKKR